MTQYSIKTENGVYTLQPTTPPTGGVTVSVPTKLSTIVTVSDFDDADAIPNKLEIERIEPIIDLTTYDKDECEHSLTTLQTTDSPNYLITFESPDSSSRISPVSEACANNGILTEAPKPQLDQFIPKRRKTDIILLDSSNLSQTVKLHRKSVECNDDVTNEIPVDIENVNKSITLCIENAETDDDPVKVDVLDEEEDDGCYESDTEVNLLEASEKQFGNSENADNDNGNDKFMGFPKIMIKNSKLMYRGKVLLNLMSKFFRLECELCTEAGCK